MANSSDSVSTPNPLFPLLWFFIITSIYFVVKFKTYDSNDPNSSKSKIFGGVYVLLLIIGEYSLNLSLTNAMCGTTQWNAALFITLVPWLFIFGILYVILSLFPGWLSPFSNTFGYGIAKLSGLTTFLNKIMADKLNLGAGVDTEASQVLEHVYSDKSLLINEVSQDPLSFNRFWTNMKVLFKSSEYNEKNKIELLSYIRLKDTVSEYIWYMLTGALVTSVSYNYVVNNGCKQSVKDMKARRKAYDANLVEKKKAALQNKPKVYSTTE